MVLLFLFCSIYPPTLLLTIEHSFSNFDLRREEILIQAYLVFLVTEHRVVARLYQVKYYYLLKCFPVTHKRGVRCPLLLLRFITCQPVMTVTGSQVRHSKWQWIGVPCQYCAKWRGISPRVWAWQVGALFNQHGLLEVLRGWENQ